MAPKTCFEMRDKGTCARGGECRFSHDRAIVAEARKAQEIEAQICRQFLPGACSRSERSCKFSHSGKEARKRVPAAYAGAAAGGSGRRRGR